MSLINQFLGEREGQQLRADIHTSSVSGYTINYYINGEFVKEETITGHSIHYAEDAAQNWLSGIKVLNG